MEFREKTQQELQNQVKKVDEIFGIPVAPHSWETLNKYEIQEKYGVRYEAYLAALRAERHGIKDEEAVQKSKEYITALNNLTKFVEKHGEGELDARGERQSSVYKDMLAFLEARKTSGYVKLPTGVGKTVIFAKLIESLGLKALVVVPTKTLVTQTGERFEQFTDIEFGKLYQKQKDYNSPVTITTYASLVSNVKNGQIDPSEIPLLILDEAHRALGDETVKVLEQFSGIKLGFTATDVFSRDKKVGDVLEECIHSMTLREAIQEGLLVTTQTIHAFTEVDLSSVPMAGDEYNQTELEKAVNVAGRNKAAIELYQKAFIGRKAICYCSGIDHAETLTKEFIKSGVSAAVITSATPEESSGNIMGRKEILSKYKSGEIMVLCNAKVLVEGFDEDSCSVGLNLHPTRSLVDAEQRGGRPGRLDPNNPAKISTVVDFIDRNAKKKPILFSEILGGAYVLRPKGKEQIGGLLDEVVTTEDVQENEDTQEFETIEKDSLILSLISIEGLRVNVDPQEVMTVTNEYMASREKKEFDFEKLKVEVLAADIKTSSEYAGQSSQMGWVSPATLIKQPEWKGWDDFLGREKFGFYKLQAEVLAADIKTYSEYIDQSSQRGWMSHSALIKQPEWKGWDDFLSRESKKQLTFEEVQAEVRAADTKSSSEYRKRAPQKGWMSPQTLLKQPEWKGWDDFLGRK